MKTPFVDLARYAPNLLLDPRYAGHDNFLGRPAAGYLAPLCLLTLSAACALAHAARLCATLGLSLQVYDGYRPQSAVDDFVRWTADPHDQIAKARYYPGVDKSDLLRLGYISAASSHSRGSAVDLGLVHLDGSHRGAGPDPAAPGEPGQALDMGTTFDFFGTESHYASTWIAPHAQRNRRLLRAVMEAAGFAGIAEEWWHFSLVHEPFAQTYFDFPVAPMGWLYAPMPAPGAWPVAA